MSALPKPSLEQIRAYYAAKPPAEDEREVFADFSPEDAAFERGGGPPPQARFCPACGVLDVPGENDPPTMPCATCYNSATPRQKHIWWSGKDRTIGEGAPAACSRCDGPAVARFTGWAKRGKGEEVWCSWCPRCDAGPASVSSEYPRPKEDIPENDEEE